MDMFSLQRRNRLLLEETEESLSSRLVHVCVQLAQSAFMASLHGDKLNVILFILLAVFGYIFASLIPVTKIISKLLPSQNKKVSYMGPGKPGKS